MAYCVGYIASSGQPVNGEIVTGSYRKAVALARSYARENLIQQSGGSAFVHDHNAHDDRPLWQWTEHAEGGFGVQVGPDGRDMAVRL